jgi:hypothetical protein
MPLKLLMRKVPIHGYKIIRSFVETSPKGIIGYEYNDYVEYIKENWVSKWKLVVYKEQKIIFENEYEHLPVMGIYRIKNNQMPIIASLTAKAGHVLDFVNLKEGLGVLNPREPYYLVFTKVAPITFVPQNALPFPRPISVREVIDTLLHYL